MPTLHTKYPILLLHGLNCRDDKPVAYFGRIPDMLRKQGVHIYLGGQDSWGTIEANALQIKKRIHQILQAEKCEKVNIIAHSKGGIDARYLVSSMKETSIASITTIATPHFGCQTVQRLWFLYPFLCFIAPISNFFWKCMGDQQPDFIAALRSLKPNYMQQFNAQNPDHTDVYYQSWSTSLNKAKHDKAMLLTRLLLYPFDGENDGLVSPRSAVWGRHRGIIQNVSHEDVVDIRKKDMPHFDPIKFYQRLIRELQIQGF